jgi:uncharacterized membrane protein (DUF106 family)
MPDSTDSTIDTNQLSDTEINDLKESRRKARVARCMEKISKTLEEENCYLDVSVNISSAGVKPMLTVVSK